MEISAQLYTPAALPPEKKTQSPNEQEAGWAPQVFARGMLRVCASCVKKFDNEKSYLLQL